MDQVIKYDKTLQERLEEYRELLGRSFSVWTVKQELSSCLEQQMDYSGWQAIWKIPRVTCEHLKIPFPTIALVYVDNVDFVKQAAEVTVLTVPEHIQIAEVHVVPLSQLWLTKEQDKTVALNLQSTGNILDVLHFFYANLCMPWDDEDCKNWVDDHLEQRLRLFYDMKNGVIPGKMVEYLKSLLTEAKRLHSKCHILQTNLKDKIIEEESNEKLEELIELQVRMMEIQKEVELFENPLSRKVLIRRHLESEQKEKRNEHIFWLVLNESTFEATVQFLQQIKAVYPNQKFKTALSFTAAIDNVAENNVIVVSKGRHKLNNCAALENGVTVKGVFGREDTVIVSMNEDVMFNLSGCVTLENLTIEASHSQCAILVQSGKVVLKNCSVIGDNVSSTHQGFIVLKGSSLELVDCCVTGFGTAVVGNSASNIKMRNCEIYSNGYGFKIHDNCAAELLNCKFYDCKEYGVLVETDRSFHQQERSVRDFSDLTAFADVITLGTTGRNNGKGNVLVSETVKIHPVSDVFSHPSLLNKTCFGINEESEASDIAENSADLNNTVIEVDSV